MRILVVEDHEKIAGFIVKGLKEERFAVDQANNGKEGLSMALVQSLSVRNLRASATC